MIDVIDWQNVNWIEGESYKALTGYTGRLPINANNVTLDMGSYVFDGDGEATAVHTTYSDVTLINGRYRNAEIGVYAKTESMLASDYNGFTLKGNPQIERCGIGVKVFGSDVKLFGADISFIDDDGIWVRGHNTEIGFCNIKEVDLTNVPKGDCIQFSESSNPHLHHCLLDHTNKTTKQAFIINSSDTENRFKNGLIEHNFILGGMNVLYAGNDNMTIRKNKIVANELTDRIINIEKVDCTLTEGNYIVTMGKEPYFKWKDTNTINRDFVS